MLRLRNKLLAADPSQDAAQDGRRRGERRERLHRGDPGRQPDLRHRGRRRVPHRGDRGQADVDQAASHHDVLRQHHPRRRLGDHDHRSERHRAGDRHRRRRRQRADEADASQQRRIETTVSLLVFRAGSPQPKAVPLSLVTRLEEIDCQKIELSNGRHLVQYRGQLMPLVPVNDEVRVKPTARSRCWCSPTRPLHGSGGRRDRRHRRGQARHRGRQRDAGRLGSAVIKGQATEIIDVGHFLPLAFEDWFRRKEMRPDARARTLLLVDDSAFFRNMLAPVLKAAGYDVTTVGGGAGGPGAAQERPALRRDRHRHRDARHGTASSSPRRCAPTRAAPTCRSSRCPR